MRIMDMIELVGIILAVIGIIVAIFLVHPREALKNFKSWGVSFKKIGTRWRRKISGKIITQDNRQHPSESNSRHVDLITSYPDNRSSPTSIIAALKTGISLDVLGEAVQDPIRDGEEGEIDLLDSESGDYLVYTRKSEGGRWDFFDKNFYQWTLKWDEKLGVIAVGRSSVSPK